MNYEESGADARFLEIILGLRGVSILGLVVATRFETSPAQIQTQIISLRINNKHQISEKIFIILTNLILLPLIEVLLELIAV